MSETELQQYFTQLKARYNLPDNITLTWMPDNSCKYHGMTSKDLKSIFIFDEDLEKAKETLKHEILEVVLTQLALILSDSRLSRDDRYRVKESIIEIFNRIEAQRDNLSELYFGLRRWAEDEYWSIEVQEKLINYDILKEENERLGREIEILKSELSS